MKAGRGFGFDGRPKVALVYAVGDIVPGESQSSPFGGGLAGSDTIVRGLRQAGQDDGVRAIVLRVDSPGGSGTASDAIWREVGLARRKKPVVVSMGDYAASGGYYIAMGADAIVAEPGTITGSIGVFSGKFSLRGLYGKLGVSQETVRRGKNATLFSELGAVDRGGAGEGPGPERGVLRDVRHQGGRGPEEDAAGDRRGGPGPGVDGARRRFGRASWTRSAGSTPRSASRGSGPASRRGRRSSIVVLPQRKGLLETLMERQDEDVLARALGPGAASFLRWATELGDRGPIARVPFDLQVR